MIIEELFLIVKGKIFHLLNAIFIILMINNFVIFMIIFVNYCYYDIFDD